MKNQAIIFLIVLALLIQFSCNYEVKPKEKADSVHAINVETAFWNAFNEKRNIQFRETCISLNKIIMTDSSRYFIHISDSIETNRNKLIAIYKKIVLAKGVYNDIAEFVFCVDSNSIARINNTIIDTSNFKNAANEHIEECWKRVKPVETIQKKIDYFGEIYVPRIIFYVYPETIIRKGRNADDWRIVFKYIENVCKAMAEYRNNLSLEKFKVPFYSLTADKKNAILDYSPLNIIISFDGECVTCVELPKSAGGDKQK